MSAPRAVPTPHTSEAQFQKELIAAAELFGWEVDHTYRGKVAKGAWRTNSRRNGRPDLFLFRDGEHMWAELKTDTGRLSEEQLVEIAKMRLAECEVHVWRPRDWESIVERLAA